MTLDDGLHACRTLMRNGTRRLALCAAPLSIQGCEGAQSALEPHGPAAARIAELWWLMAVLGTVVTVVVVGLLVYAVLHRGPRGATADEGGAPDPARSRRALRAVIVAGIIVPAPILAILFAITMRSLGAIEAERPPDLRVLVDGRQFWWEMRYLDAAGTTDFVTANELHIPVGRTVEVVLVAGDVIHSFWVPSLAGKLDMIPGDTNRLVLRAERPGVYRGQCAEYCGAQHARMAFLVVAESPAMYEQWAALQRAPAAEPTSPAALRGRQVFTTSECAACHAIRGVSDSATAQLARRVGGRVGPDLTHLASRRTLAAATIPNTRGHLGGWIGNPQGVKPGSFMPAVPLDGDPLLLLLEYLSTLR